MDDLENAIKDTSNDILTQDAEVAHSVPMVSDPGLASPVPSSSAPTSTERPAQPLNYSIAEFGIAVFADGFHSKSCLFPTRN